MICHWMGRGEHRETCPWPDDLRGQIRWLQLHGSALDMNWDADSEAWEMWVMVGGRRIFTSGSDPDPGVHLRTMFDTLTA